MIRKSTEILISGGGIAGLTSACAFANAGFDVVCVDPLPPITDSVSAHSDLRSTAFLQPARNTLENAGLWECFEKFATPLEIMRLADAGGINNEIRMVADFNALEISDAPFAWNLPNWLLRRELVKHIQSLSNVTLLFGQKTGRITTRIAENLVMVGNEQYSCQLLIGADGRNSSTRQEMKIPVKTWRYGQKAISMAVCHSSPHKNISTEIHRSARHPRHPDVPSRERDSQHSARSPRGVLCSPRRTRTMPPSKTGVQASRAVHIVCGILWDIVLRSGVARTTMLDTSQWFTSYSSVPPM